MIILSDQIFESAYVITDNGNELATMPIDFLKDPRRSVFWRAISTGITEIRIQTAGDNFTHIAIVDTNQLRDASGFSTARIRVLGFSDAFGGNVEFDVNKEIPDIAPNFYGNLLGLGGYTGVDQNEFLMPPIVFDVGGVQNSPFITVEMVSGSNGVPYQMSNILIGEAIQFGNNIESNWDIVSQSNSITKKTIGGTLYKNSSTNVTRVNFSAKFVTESEQFDLFVRKLKEGKRKNIVLQVRPTSPYEDKDYLCYYGKIISETYTPNFENNTIVNFVFEEAM